MVGRDARRNLRPPLLRFALPGPLLSPARPATGPRLRPGSARGTRGTPGRWGSPRSPPIRRVPGSALRARARARRPRTRAGARRPGSPVTRRASGPVTAISARPSPILPSPIRPACPTGFCRTSVVPWTRPARERSPITKAVRSAPRPVGPVRGLVSTAPEPLSAIPAAARSARTVPAKPWAARTTGGTAARTLTASVPARATRAAVRTSSASTRAEPGPLCPGPRTGSPVTAAVARARPVRTKTIRTTTA
jgi:hypothetical protein